MIVYWFMIHTHAAIDACPEDVKLGLLYCAIGQMRASQDVQFGLLYCAIGQMCAPKMFSLVCCVVL